MIDFSNITKSELDTNRFFFATEEEANLFGAVITEELEVRVGSAIAEIVGEEKAQELEAAANDSLAAEWLNINCPNYRDIVQRKQEELYDEMIEKKSQIPGLLIKLPPDMRCMSIDDMDISVRSTNILKRAGFKTVGEILDYGDISTIKNMGEKCKNEIMAKLWKLDSFAALPPAPLGDDLNLPFELEDTDLLAFDDE